MLHGIGATVIYTSRREAAETTANFVSLPDLLAAADVVSLHVPLTAETAGMIDGPAIEKMKQGAILVNTARGGLVDYDALHRALAAGACAAPGSTYSLPNPRTQRIHSSGCTM